MPSSACLLRAALACGILVLPACRTRRILAVESVPPGALVRFDEEVIGRTPLEHEFVHYGKRRLTLYMPGYHTWSERIDLDAPLRARFPFDIIWELIIPLGRTDKRSYHVELRADRGEEEGGDVDVDSFLERAWARRLKAEQAAENEDQEQDDSQSGSADGGS